MTQAKVWNREAVHQLLETNAVALSRAILTIYARQTAAEKASGSTVEHNGRGFSGRDAAFLSDIAQKLPRYENRLTPRQRAKVLPLMKRYWRQLLEEIEAKGGEVSYARAARREAVSRNRDEAAPEIGSIAAALAPVRAAGRGTIARSLA